MPEFYSLGPGFDFPGGVAAGVEVAGAVEADVGEVGGDVVGGGVFAGDVGDGQGDVVPAEEGGEAVGEEALVAELDGVADGAVGVGGEFDLAFARGVVLAGEFGEVEGGVGEEVEEGFESVFVEGEVGGKLPEDGAELVAEAEQAGG